MNLKTAVHTVHSTGTRDTTGSISMKHDGQMGQGQEYGLMPV